MSHQLLCSKPLPIPRRWGNGGANKDIIEILRVARAIHVARMFLLGGWVATHNGVLIRSQVHLVRHWAECRFMLLLRSLDPGHDCGVLLRVRVDWILLIEVVLHIVEEWLA